MGIDWSEYSRVHRSRANLIIHLFAVPLFIASVVSLIRHVVRGDWVSAFIVIIVTVLAMAVQGAGHRKELHPPRPFTGPVHFLCRWFSEQFLIFPVFFLSGRWWNQYQAAAVLNES